MGCKVPMSTLLLKLSTKVLIFLCKIRKGLGGAGKGGKLWKSIWAFQKKICQWLLDLKLPFPRPLVAISRAGKCSKCPQNGGSLGPNPV